MDLLRLLLIFVTFLATCELANARISSINYDALPSIGPPIAGVTTSLVFNPCKKGHIYLGGCIPIVDDEYHSVGFPHNFYMAT